MTNSEIIIGAIYRHPDYPFTRYKGEYDGKNKILRITEDASGFKGNIVLNPEQMTENGNNGGDASCALDW